MRGSRPSGCSRSGWSRAEALSAHGARSAHGAPRPRRSWANSLRRTSSTVPTRTMWVQARPIRPLVPGRRARITAWPAAASAGVNGAATALASAPRPGGGCAAVHDHDVAGLERLEQLIVGELPAVAAHGLGNVRSARRRVRVVRGVQLARPELGIAEIAEHVADRAADPETPAGSWLSEVPGQQRDQPDRRAATRPRSRRAPARC